MSYLDRYKARLVAKCLEIFQMESKFEIGLFKDLELIPSCVSILVFILEMLKENISWALCVDDIISFRNNMSYMKSFKSWIISTFNKKDLGEAMNFLDQQQYISWL